MSLHTHADLYHSMSDTKTNYLTEMLSGFDRKITVNGNGVPLQCGTLYVDNFTNPWSVESITCHLTLNRLALAASDPESILTHPQPFVLTNLTPNTLKFRFGCAQALPLTTPPDRDVRWTVLIPERIDSQAVPEFELHIPGRFIGDGRYNDDAFRRIDRLIDGQRTDVESKPLVVFVDHLTPPIAQPIVPNLVVRSVGNATVNLALLLSRWRLLGYLAQLTLVGQFVHCANAALHASTIVVYQTDTGGIGKFDTSNHDPIEFQSDLIDAGMLSMCRRG